MGFLLAFSFTRSLSSLGSFYNFVMDKGLVYLISILNLLQYLFITIYTTLFVMDFHIFLFNHLILKQEKKITNWSRGPFAKEKKQKILL